MTCKMHTPSLIDKTIYHRHSGPKVRPLGQGYRTPADSNLPVRLIYSIPLFRLPVAYVLKIKVHISSPHLCLCGASPSLQVPRLDETANPGVSYIPLGCLTYSIYASDPSHSNAADGSSSAGIQNTILTVTVPLAPIFPCGSPEESETDTDHGYRLPGPHIHAKS